MLKTHLFCEKLDFEQGTLFSLRDASSGNGRTYWRLPWALLLLIAMLSTAACGAQASPSTGVVTIRTPYPTFTPVLPTQPPLAAASGEGSGTGSAAAEGVAVSAADKQGVAAVNSAEFTGVSVLVASPLVNVRSGPDTTFDVVGIVEEGQTFDVLGQDESGTWWQICCYDDEPVWVIDDLVTTSGATESVAAAPVAQPPTAAPQPTATTPPPAQVAAAATQPTAEEAPAEAAPADPAPAADGFTFNLELAEQFPETNVVRVFLYVYNDEEGALSGYSLRVTKDGAELPVGETSFGPQPGFTWPIADDRQRFQNLKAEFPGQAPGGTWEVQLVDGGGSVVGPPATFSLSGSEPSRELYVRYAQR